MLVDETPIEQYKIGDKTVYVKREDLFGRHPAPALAKLRGAYKLLEKWKGNGWTRVAAFDTRISKAGQGVAYICKELGMECAVGFPVLKGQRELAPQQQIAKELGAKLVSVQAGRTNICYHAFKREMEIQGYRVLPLGLTCIETVIAVRTIASELPEEYGAVVLSTGTGTIATGVALGILYAHGGQCKVIGVSCGMSPIKQWSRITIMATAAGFIRPSNLSIAPAEYDYYDALDISSCPFPTSPYYDMKAWVWLRQHIDELREPILFWNIGT